jgi:hypothetical protein
MKKLVEEHIWKMENLILKTTHWRRACEGASNVTSTTSTEGAGQPHH